MPHDPRADADAIGFVLALGEALHRYGATAPRLEEALTQVAAAMDLEARFFSTPTSILASFGPAHDGRSCLVRVQPGEVQLEKLTLLDAVVDETLRERIAPAAARARVEAVLARAPPYGAGLSLLCYGLASAAAAVFFGGGPPEVAASALVGVAVGVVSRTTVTRDGFGHIQDTLAAALAAAVAVGVSRLLPGTSPSVVTLSGIIALLPGLTLTSAMLELASRHLASGTARFAGGAVSLLGLGFGVALGSAAAARALPPPVAVQHAHVWPLPLQGLAVLVASLSFMVLLRARWRDAPAIVAAGALAFGGNALGGRALGPELGAFAGAYLVGLGSNLYARRLRRPALVPLVPGILLLVPGSVGFRGVLSMLDRAVVPAVEASFVMLTTAVALVAGLIAATVTHPARRAL
jgi:uncharacterized membrane protein YjjP (DUF1212 family)